MLSHVQEEGETSQAKHTHELACGRPNLELVVVVAGGDPASVTAEDARYFGRGRCGGDKRMGGGARGRGEHAVVHTG